VDPVPDHLLLRKSGRAGNRTRDLWLCRLDHRRSKPNYYKVKNKAIPVTVFVGKPEAETTKKTKM
jgi:hypothetical protein